MIIQKTINRKFKKDDLDMIIASIDDLKNKLLIDSGSNLKFYFPVIIWINCLSGEYDIVDIFHGLIYRAFSNDTISDSIVIPTLFYY